MKLKQLGLSLALCAATALPARAAVIISEIMYNAAGSDDNREWVEIYNTGNAAVDISGWRLFDEDAGSQPGSPIPAGTSLGPSQALVLIEAETQFVADWGSAVNRLLYPGMGTGLNMANTGTVVGDEVLMLQDSVGNIVDQVDYSNAAPWPLVADATATAIYLLPESLSASANDLGTSWARSTAGIDGGRLATGRTDAGSPGVVIPEPASFALAGCAIAGVLVSRRRKN